MTGPCYKPPLNQDAVSTVELKRRYVEVHRQRWIPIFVRDDMCVLKLAEACLESGLSVIEVTLRRPGVMREIESIRHRFPTLTILAGSVVSNETLLSYARRRRHDLPSMDDLASIGVDGFVSQLPMSDGDIERFSATHLLLPGCETIEGAVHVIEAGAHFAKFFSLFSLGGMDRLRNLTSEASHRLLPIFIAGGVTADRLGETLDAGAALTGTGWDAILAPHGGASQRHSVADLSRALRPFVDAAGMENESKTDAPHEHEMDAYLERLVHFHPFHLTNAREKVG